MSKESTSPFVERLPCTLSSQEKELKAVELARTVTNRDALAYEKSLAAQRYAKQIKTAERRIGDLAEEVRSGIEYREVQVTERRDFDRNVVEIIRLDTKEVCGQRAMRAEERQAEMFPKKPGEPAEDRQLELGAAREQSGPGDDDDDDGLDDDELDDDELDDEGDQVAAGH